MANSGSFGFTALMHMPEATVSDELAEMSRVTNGRFGANLTLVVDQRKSLADAVARECDVYSEVLCSAATLQTMDNYSATRLALRE
jgi:nitronate monooxygenase